MIVNINDDTAMQIEKNLKIVSQSVDNIKNLVNISYLEIQEKEKKEQLQHPYIVKSILKHIATGLNEYESFKSDRQNEENYFYVYLIHQSLKNEVF